MSGKKRLKIVNNGSGEDPESDKKPILIHDKRRVSAEGTLSGDATEPNLKPSYVETLEARVKKTEDAFKERVSSLQEETTKSRERLKKDLELRFESDKNELFREVLTLLDDLERASSTKEEKSLREGLALIASNVDKFLERRGCGKLFPEGEEFDPETMEAISTGPGPKGVVLVVVQAGYALGDTLLRPARVVVGDGSEGRSKGD